MTQLLELTLRAAATDGIAYFVDEAGNPYFHPRDAAPIRPLIDGKDNHPMMYQFSRPNPLAEVGRKFKSPEEANKYVDAVTSFATMMLFVEIAGRTDLSDDARKIAEESVVQTQGMIRQKHMQVLDTVKGFEHVKKYLDMPPKQIYESAQRQGTC
ncbi:hypothetical protein HY642_05555 [Candidatus Woesearchaeota archaeon]|nr:hypothetical protein [Candidatus Woesearchaeota archaeon]